MMKPLHIISVNQDPGISPSRKKGAAVHLQAMRTAFRQTGVEVWELDEPDESKLRESLQRIAGTQNVQLIYERYALGRSAAARFAREHGISYTLEVNAPLADEQQRWRGQPEGENDCAEDAVVFGSAAFIAAVSSEVADYAEKRGGRSECIHLCPNGIDSALFKPYSKAASKANLGLPGECFVVGFHGRERPWHGFDMLVDVSQALLGQSLPVHLLVVGEGEFKALDRLPQGTFTRLPWMEHAKIPECISAFDVLPLSYSQDAPCYFSPLKLMEGMASGVVPVVPDLGDLPTVVRHLRNGWVYEAGRHEALLDALLALFRDPDLRSRLAAGAVESARSNGWDRIACKVLDHFGLEYKQPVVSSFDSLDEMLGRAKQYLDERAGKGWIERIEIDRRGGLNFLLVLGDDRCWIDFAAKPAHLRGPLDDPAIPLAARVVGAGAESGYEILNYRPSRRLVVAGRHDDTDVVLKGYRKGKCAAPARKAQLAAQILEGSDIGTATILDVNLHDDYVLMQRMGGNRPGILAQQADDFLALGKGMHWLQAAPGVSEQDLLVLEEFSRGQELAVLDERLRRLKRVGGSLPPLWPELRVRVEEAAARIPPAAQVTAHRDLHDGQWLIDQGQPCLLDFDLLCRAEPELDPANFLAHLSLRHLQQSDQLSAHDRDMCGEAFLQGLDLPATRDSQCRLHFYQASSFARLALVYLLRPQWQKLVPELVNRGHRCLDDLQQVGA